MSSSHSACNCCSSVVMPCPNSQHAGSVGKAKGLRIHCIRPLPSDEMLGQLVASPPIMVAVLQKGVCCAMRVAMVIRARECSVVTLNVWAFEWCIARSVRCTQWRPPERSLGNRRRRRVGHSSRSPGRKLFTAWAAVKSSVRRDRLATRTEALRPGSDRVRHGAA